MNYVTMARTNYVRVRDEAKFREMASRFSPEPDVVQSELGLALLMSDGMPDEYRRSDDPEEWIECEDWVGAVAEELENGEVLVVQWVGYEGMRYVAGGSIAVSASGRQIELSLDDIYDRIHELTDAPDGVTIATH